jgi:hypothetical protein
MNLPKTFLTPNQQAEVLAILRSMGEAGVQRMSLLFPVVKDTRVSIICIFGSLNIELQKVTSTGRLEATLAATSANLNRFLDNPSFNIDQDNPFLTYGR